MSIVALFARDLHIRTEVLYGRRRGQEDRGVRPRAGHPQVFMGRPRPRGRWELRENVVQRVVRIGKEMEITVVAERRR